MHTPFQSPCRLFRPLLFALCLLLACISTSQAQTPAEAPVSDLPEPLQHLENQGIQIIRDFPVSELLTGWVISFEGRDLVVYTTADGQHLLNGTLLNAQGMDLTEQHRQQQLPQPEWADMQTGAFVTEPSLLLDEQGQLQTRSRIYVFFDPYCPFCHLAWLALQPYRQVGLEVHWLPVAYLQPDSRNQAISLLASDPQQQGERLAAIMQTTGELPAAEVDPETAGLYLAQLQHNTDLMLALGLNATPGWVWQDAQGQLQVHAGMPRLARLAEITGLPEQHQSHTELMRFR